jgi:hypothetical protein
MPTLPHLSRFRSPQFWVLFTAIALAAAVFARTQYSTAFPLLEQKLSMTRDAATAAAQGLAGRQKWSQSSARAATRLYEDSTLTTFIELEAGGRENLRALLRDGRIAPHLWQVRLFQEKDAAETLVQFRPDGRLFGFLETLPEAQPGALLDEAPARELAQRSTAELGIDLSAYHLAESRSNQTPSGRVDRFFTFERDEPRLAAGRDQLVLTVRGDRFCGAEPRVKIPDDFFRRYTAMRATNTNLQLAATVAIYLLLGLGCTAGGLWYLSRHRAIDWRGALPPTVLLALGAGLLALNNLPLTWFAYNTALSPGQFLTNNIVGSVLVALGTLVLLFIFAGAEGLSRLAFPLHPRLWTALTARAAGSRQIVGAVTGSYGAALLFLGYAVWMARFGADRLGWWMPSGALFDLGQMGSVVPWFPPFFNSLQAGIYEECLFRALPLAAATLNGHRLGRPRLVVGVALVVQALIFGAAHSNYATMPGWARMAELTLPAIGFGLLYLRFGLLPGILTHFLYDLALMGLPLFTAETAGSRGGAAILVALGFAPLAWVWVARLRAGTWQDLPADLCNGDWSAPKRAAKPLPAATLPTPALADSTRPVLSATALRVMALAGLVAVVAWAVSIRNVTPDTPGIGQRRDTAIAQARAALASDGVQLGADWEARPIAYTDSDREHRFVWDTSGRGVFHRLLGSHLPVPGWRVRFLRPQLPLPDRAEEYHVFLAGDGRVQRFRHILPETRPGAHLEKAAAQAVATLAMQRIYHLDPANLTLVSANETKQPERSDWAFVWKDATAGLAQGEAHFRIEVAGDSLSCYERRISASEDWVRAQASGNDARQVVTGLAGIATVIALLGAIVATLCKAGRPSFSWRAALGVAAIGAVMTALQFGVNLPAQLAWMSTNEPTNIQLARSGVGLVVSVLFMAASLGWLAGLGAGAASTSRRRITEFLAGLGAGSLLLVGERIVQLVSPHYPWHAGIDGASSGIPCLGELWIPMMLLGSALCWVRVHTALSDYFRPGLARCAIVAAMGLAFGASLGGNGWLAIALNAAVFALAIPLFDRMAALTHPAVLVAVATTRCIGKSIGEYGLPGHLDARPQALVALGLTAIIGVVLYRLLRPAGIVEVNPETPASGRGCPPPLPPQLANTGTGA